MKVLTVEEGKQWLAKNSLGRIYLKRLDTSYALKAMFRFPKDVGQTTRLVSALAKQFASTEQHAYLWMVDWGAWPNLSIMDLFYGYRKSLGEDRSLIDAPFHVFTRNDNDKLVSLLGLSMYFFWDSILGNVGWDVALSISHDEIIDAYADRREDLKILQDLFGVFGIEQLK